MHPYRSQPDRSFWARSVSSNWDPLQTVRAGTELLRPDDRVLSLGSCFAANLVPYLRENGYTYVETERRHAEFADSPEENLSYGKFSAAYGNIYTTRQFLQLLHRAYGHFYPIEDRWHDSNEVVDPFRPGLRYRAQSDAEFDALTAYHLSRVRAAFEEATIVIFTLGLTEAWCSAADGAVYPACPGTIAGTFDPDRHVFHNFSVSEIVDDLRAILTRLRFIRADMRVILTVSPVPLVATATDDHVLVASTYSKSVLRVACGEVAAQDPGCAYFPAYELITGPQAPEDFFEPDRRNASRKGIDTVMAAFLAHCQKADGGRIGDQPEARPADLSQLSRDLGDIECEEAAAAR